MLKSVLPPTYFLASLALMAALAFAFPIAPLVDWPWRALGVAPSAAGVCLNLAADRSFKTRGTTVKPFERSSTLVVELDAGVGRPGVRVGSQPVGEPDRHAVVGEDDLSP